MIKGITNLSLIDWDNEVCCTIFMGGCNFRCPWCHNAPLVLNPEKLETIHEDHVLQLIEGFGKYIDGICISGGEPTLYGKNLIVFCEKLKALDLKVKLDTNGTDPDTLRYLISNKCVDYIAMDVKAPLTIEKYSHATGIPIDEEILCKMMRSIDIIRYECPDYEFRTTVVPQFHTIKDIEEICKYGIMNAKKYIIQNFRPCETIIDLNLSNIKLFSTAELEAFYKIAQPWVYSIKIRILFD